MGVAAITALAVFGYCNYDVRRAIAVAQRDTAEARVELYLAAVARGDQAAPRGWVLRDVYPSGAAPTYNRFPGR